MEMNFEDIRKEFSKKANEIYKDNEKLKDMLDELAEKIKNNEMLSKISSDIKLTIDMLLDWKDGKYEDLSKDTVILILVGFLYILSPVSIIPNSSIFKYLDDILVFAFIIKKIKDELEVYKEWKGQEDLPTGNETDETVYIDLN